MRNAAVLVLILFSACTAGCFLLDERQVTPGPATATVTQVTVTESGMSSIEPADMAFQLPDLPVGYIIRERADIAYSDTSPLAREQGWKRGYTASFYRMNAEKYDITAINQRIGIYNVGNVHLLDRTMGPVFDHAKSSLIGAANATVAVTELPFPKVGDQTTALRSIDASDPYGVVIYTVIFTKKDVIETIEMRGTTTDFEVLKNLARKAAEKIR